MSGHVSGGLPDDEKRWELLARYLAGEADPVEEAAVRRLLLEDPSTAALFHALSEMGTAEREASADVDVERALAQVKARIAAKGSRRTRTVPGWRAADTARAPARWRVAGLAAAAALLLAIGTLQSWRMHRGERVAPSAARTFASAVGARDSVRLPDGSRVLLGPGTVLTMTAGYGAAAREVRVTGEAYFDVRHDAASPFVVHAGSATIRDVGTSFTVHDDARGDVRVVVTTGAVLLRSARPADSGVVLHAGDAGAVRDGTPAVAHAAAGTGDDLAWTRGQLVFRDAPLADVAADLRRWYGIELVVVDPALTQRHFTATFSGDAAPHVVNVIALALGAQVQWHGDTVVMRR